MPKLILVPLIAILLMQGCVSLGRNVPPEVTVNPRFPAPSESTIDDLIACHSINIDAWMVELCKLCEKLEEDCSCEQNTDSPTD